MAQLSELWVQFVGLPNISVTIHGRMISDFFFPSGNELPVVFNAAFRVKGA